MTLTFTLELNVERADGKRARGVAQAISEQLFEVLDAHCQDQMFEVGGADHAVSLQMLELVRMRGGKKVKR